MPLRKACQNEVEQQGARNAHLRDAVAVIRFLHFLAEIGLRGYETEMSAAANLRTGDVLGGPSADVTNFVSEACRARTPRQPDRLRHGRRSGHRRATALALAAAGARVIATDIDAAKVGRLGTPEEIAELAVYLASYAAQFITGQAIVIDGGLTL